MVDFSSITTGLFGGGEASKAKLFTLGSGLLDSTAAIKNGIASKKAADQKALILRRDAENRRQAADDLRKQGRQTAQQIQVETAQLISSQRAALAANGLVLDQGTALDLAVETAGQGSVDAITTIANAEREAAQLVAEAAGDDLRAGLFQRQGRDTRTAGFSTALTTLLQTGKAIEKLGDLESPAET